MKNDRKIVDPVIFEKEVSQENKSLVQEFLIQKKSEGRRPATIKQYSEDMRVILWYIYKDFGNKSLLKLTKKDVRNLLLKFMDRGLSTARINRLIGTLRVALTVFEDDDEIDYDRNVAAKVKGLEKKKVKEVTFLTHEQILWLKDKLVEQENYLLAVYLMLSYTSAARRGEVHQVLKQGLTERFTTIPVEGKRGKVFPLYYDQLCQDLIKLYLKQRGEDDCPYLFVKLYKGSNKRSLVNPSTFNEWCEYFSKLLSEKENTPIPINPHCFRHSRIEYLARVQNFPLEKIKSLVNHQSVAMTEYYLSDNNSSDVADLFGMDATLLKQAG